MKIWIGHDGREQPAYDAAARTARRFDSEVKPLYESRLRAAGLLTRPVDRRERLYDLHSSAYQATEFANARFFVPLLEHSGWCLFVDADVVFLSDPEQVMDHADPRKAALVVKHPPLPEAGLKMDGQHQLAYARKNWSSVVLWNCDHPANKRLNLSMLNQWPGRDLHAFGWLHDDELGELPDRFNWLVNVRPRPDDTVVAHFTLGGPFLEGWKGAEYDSLWLEAAK